MHLIDKRIVGKFLKRSLSATQLHIHFGLQTIGFHAVEPFRIQVDTLIAREADDLRQVKLHLQTVGLHSLHTEVLGDGACTHFEACRPKTRLIRHIGRNGEAIDVVDRLGVHLLGIETAIGVNHLEDNGIVIGQRGFQVVEHEVELQVIAGTPYATVGVSECRHTFLDRLARNIEATVRQGITIVQLDNRFATFLVGSHHKSGTVSALQLQMALAIDSALAEFLFLEVVGHHLCARCRLGIRDAIDKDIHQVVATHLGRHSEVADDDVLLFLHIIIIIVAVRIAVFAIVTVFLVVVALTVPIIGFFLIVVINNSVPHLIGGESVVGRAEIEAQLIHGTWLHLNIIG